MPDPSPPLWYVQIVTPNVSFSITVYLDLCGIIIHEEIDLPIPEYMLTAYLMLRNTGDRISDPQGLSRLSREKNGQLSPIYFKKELKSVKSGRFYGILAK